MDRAFRAPRYDGYFDRHWQPTREVWNHHPDLSASVIFNSLWVHSLPDVPSIRNYGNYLVHSAPRASDAGHAAEAETLSMASVAGCLSKVKPISNKWWVSRSPIEPRPNYGIFTKPRVTSMRCGKPSGA